MMFMACSLDLLWRHRDLLHRHPEVRAHLARASKDAGPIITSTAILRGSLSLAPQDDGGIPSHPRHIELRLLAGAVAPQRAVFADRVGALKGPVLPRRQAREDFRFHGLGSDEAQVRFHAGETVRRETGALLEEHPDLVVPIDIVEREGDEAKLLGLLGIDRLADLVPRALQIGRIGLKARLQSG